MTRAERASVSIADLDPSTPVIVGVGQASERLDDPDYAALGEADLAARAVHAAFGDSGADQNAIAAAVDTVAAVRSFEVSSPVSTSPLGRPDNMPRAVAARTGMSPRRAVVAVTGGQSPQALVNEFARTIADGGAEVVVLFGAEAISTIRNLLADTNSAADSHDTGLPDFTEHVDGQLEDRGFGLAGITTVDEARHGLIAPALQYAVFENARRHRLGLGRTEYAQAMGELFAPMTRVAATNPHAAAPTVRTVEELVIPTARNRMVADPYTRMLIARDQVNQAAVVIITSVRAATELGIDPSRWAFLHGQADLREQTLLARPDLSVAPAASAAVRHALEVAGRRLDDMSHLDIYSCFPIAVFTFCDEFGVAADDPRGLTVTGGLPYFGGPGNNYSMHAIAETVQRVRDDHGALGIVAANGGVLSKYSVGIYSGEPRAWRRDDSAAVQAILDKGPTVDKVRYADGEATVETFTVSYGKDGHRTAIVLGRMADGDRFVARTASGDSEMLALLESDWPFGAPIHVVSGARGNVAYASETTAARHNPASTPRLRTGYETVTVHRDGHRLEVTINRPETRNALNPKANGELDEIFDAFFADPDLWVAILTGAGTTAFSAGNDLTETAAGGGLTVPRNGFAGLTGRAHLPKPVIAAVNGYALGGGCEVALACHIVVADETAQFGLPEVRVGLAAAAGGLVRLPRTVGPALARDMILTGRRLTADEALRAGLVSRVSPAGAAVELARTVADEILAGSPTSVRASIAAMADAEDHDAVLSAVEASTSVLDTLLTSQDTVEGLTSFLAGRPPRWTGR